MHRKYSRWQRKPVVAQLAVILSLAGASLACRIEPPRIITEADTPTPQQIVITQVVTQVITPTAAPQQTPTPAPTDTPLPEPTATPTWSIVDAPIYYPLKDCVASRLHIGDRAMVSLVGGPNGIRYGLDIHVDTIALYAQPGDVLDIVGGPWCSHGWLVWMVRTATGFVGYTPEGDGNNYWLFPVPPGS